MPFSTEEKKALEELPVYDKLQIKDEVTSFEAGIVAIDRRDPPHFTRNFHNELKHLVQLLESGILLDEKGNLYYFDIYHNDRVNEGKIRKIGWEVTRGKWANIPLYPARIQINKHFSSSIEEKVTTFNSVNELLVHLDEYLRGRLFFIGGNINIEPEFINWGIRKKSWA